MRFVRLAEQIFTAFGWNDVRNIDLIARAKATPLDLKVSNIPEFESSLSTKVTDAEYGYSYYRY